MWILDTSVAVKWFFNDEPHREDAVRVLDFLTRKPDSVMVPDFFFHELTAVCIRKTGYEKKLVLEYLNTVYQMGITKIDLGEELSQEAINLACDYKISFYDAIYVALARLMKGIWLTADKKALHKLPKNLARHLPEF